MGCHISRNTHRLEKDIHTPVELQNKTSGGESANEQYQMRQNYK